MPLDAGEMSLVQNLKEKLKNLVRGHWLIRARALAGLVFLSIPSASLQLDYIPEASPQSLFPYLAKPSS